MSKFEFPPQNAFSQTLLGLEYTVDGKADLFSEACVATFETCDWDIYGYPFTQIMESSVLEECATLAGIRFDRVKSLEEPQTDALCRLLEMSGSGKRIENDCNVASAAISISRFDFAQHKLGAARARLRTERDRFEVEWLGFLLSNRASRLEESAASFKKMHQAIETGEIPVGRMLDAATQAVVWYFKRREVNDAVYLSFLKLGKDIVASGKVGDPGSLSAWHRGYAMVPAAEKDADATRNEMRKALELAQMTGTAAEKLTNRNLVKTYYESAIKEHMYVTGDLEKAVEAGEMLIVFDPAWSPSYGELAEVHVRIGNMARAAELYESAARLGPPYVCHHLFKAAGCLIAQNRLEEALDHHRTLATLIPENETLLASGRKLAKRLSETAEREFLEIIAGTRREPRAEAV